MKIPNLVYYQGNGNKKVWYVLIWPSFGKQIKNCESPCTISTGWICKYTLESNLTVSCKTDSV